MLGIKKQNLKSLLKNPTLEILTRFAIMAKASDGTKMSQNTIDEAQKNISNVLNDLHSTGVSRQHPFCIGKVSSLIERFAADKGIKIGSSEMYMSVRQIVHTFRESKAARKIDEADLIAFPKEKGKMQIYYDGKVFVYTDLRNKFIVEPNYSLKVSRNKTKVVNYITASKVMDVSEFSNKGRYIRIK